MFEMKKSALGKIITFFNHKGGVGKTTLVHNLGALLAEKGHKLLLIDAEPQMNLAAAMYGFSIGVEYSKDGSSKWSEYTKDYISLDDFSQNNPFIIKEPYHAVADGLITLLC